MWKPASLAGGDEMVHLFSDILGAVGGIESYLHALAIKLREAQIPFRVWVCEAERSKLIEELVDSGVEVCRQGRVPGDRWRMRQRLLARRMSSELKPGDWVYCVREPMEQIYSGLVDAVHRRGAKIAASWMLSPRSLEVSLKYEAEFCHAVAKTDAVISVSRCGVSHFREVYGYEGEVKVVRYHNLLLFDDAVPLPDGPPWKIGYMGRLSVGHKNLDGLMESFCDMTRIRKDVELHVHGSGPEEEFLKDMARSFGCADTVYFHGEYDHRRDLKRIMERCHFFAFPSRMEGGPSFVLLEYLQAGRYCVAAAVGGAPDVYQGRSDAGLMVAAGDKRALTSAMLEVVEKLERGLIDGNLIRARYFEEFDMEHAHKEWVEALGLDGGRVSA